VGILAWLHPVTDSSWRWVVLAGAAPAVITFLIQFFVPESHKWKESQKVAPSRPLSELFGSSELSWRAVLAIVFASIALLGTWGAVQKIPSWISIGEVKNASVNARPFTQILCGLGAIVGCLIAPYLAAILSRRVAYFLLCLGSFISCEVLFGGFTHYGPALLVMVFIVGGMSAAFYGWLPLYLPELFPTRVRATAQGIAFNSGRVLAAVGSIGLASMSGGYGRMGMIVSSVYILGMIAIWFAPETKGKALPE
jgi:MFS family permease